jgi:hypothetical protein
MRLALKVVYTAQEFNKLLCMFFLFTLSTTFNLFNLEGRNLLFVGAGVFISILLVIGAFRRAPNFFSNSVILLFLYMTASYLTNMASASLTSFLYSLFFMGTFIIVATAGAKFLEEIDLLNIIKFILAAYFIVLLIGQLYVLFGLFTPDTSDRLNLHGHFGTAFSREKMAIRFYSLATEPSYASIIVVFLYYLFLEISNRIGNTKKLFITLITLYMLFVFSSAFGFLLMAILLWLRLHKLRPDFAVISMLLLLVAFITLVFVDFDIYGITRLKNIIRQFDFTNWESVRKIDYSASFRILPTYFYAKTADSQSIHFYLGHGAGVSDKLLNRFLFPHAPDAGEFHGGFFPGYLIDYGIIGFIIFILVFFKETKDIFSFGTIVLLISFTNANFNTQLIWLIVTFLYLNQKLKNKQVA